MLRGTTEVARGAKGALGPQHLVDVLLEPAVTELMRSRDPEPVLAAQDLLCLLGEGTPDAVLRALLAHCEAGVLPQPCVLRTLADVANARPAVGVPALKMELLPRIMPQLGAAKGEARQQHRLGHSAAVEADGCVATPAPRWQRNHGQAPGAPATAGGA